MDWISVDDRLPEKGTYLIINKWGGMMVWQYDDGWKKYGYGQEITHYMPLPQPPVNDR